MTRRQVVIWAGVYACGVALFLTIPRPDPSRLPDLWFLPAAGGFIGGAIGAAWRARRAGESTGDAIGIGLAWLLGLMIMGWSLIGIAIAFGPAPGESLFERLAPIIFPYSLAPLDELVRLFFTLFFGIFAIGAGLYALRKLMYSDD